MNAGAVSTSAGSVHVALWGNGAVLSALKCHETGAILCVYTLVGNLQTYERGEACVRGLSDLRSAKAIPSARNPLLTILRLCHLRCRISPRFSIGNVAKGA
jgi:hypothetical protein